MVNDIQARLIAKEVVKKYGIGMQAKVISREEALPIVGFKKGGNVADVPPSFFDFNTLYIIDPQTNWPEEGQIDADGGKAGISQRFCFYLVVHEFGHKRFAPQNAMIAIQEKALLERTQKGWGKLRPHMDNLIVDTTNIKSEFVAKALEEFPGLIRISLLQKYGPFLARNKTTKRGGHYSSGSDITDWWEIHCRLMVAVAEEDSPGKAPNQGPESGSTGILWPGLKKSENGKKQMETLLKMHQLLAKITANITERRPDWAQYLTDYEMLAQLQKEVLGDMCSRIYKPPSISFVNEFIPDITTLGPFKNQLEAEKLLAEIMDIREEARELTGEVA